MRKQFSFKEYLTYAFRYWLITAVCLVVGLGVGVIAAALSPQKATVCYEGQAEIAGITVLYPDAPTQGMTEAYNRMCDNAFTVMTDDRNRLEMFGTLGAEYKKLTKQKNEEKITLEFYDGYRVWRSGNILKVSFSIEEADGAAAFCQKAVDAYLAHVCDKALSAEPRLAERDNSISVRSAVSMPVERKSALGKMLTNAVIGLAGGLFAGLAVTLLVYLFDPRLASYRDVAPVTGNALLGVSAGAVDPSFCPKIDGQMQDDKCLLLTGSADTCARLATMYADYAAHTDAGALAVLFDGDGGESLQAFLSGKAIGDCVETDGKVHVLHAGKSTLTLADAKKLCALTAVYDRVVFAKGYAADGMTAVLAKASDKVIYAFDYKKARIKSSYLLAAEVGEPQKAAGGIIENVHRGFVGSAAYFAEEDEAEDF